MRQQWIHLVVKSVTCDVVRPEATTVLKVDQRLHLQTKLRNRQLLRSSFGRTCQKYQVILWQSNCRNGRCRHAQIITSNRKLKGSAIDLGLWYVGREPQALLDLAQFLFVSSCQHRYRFARHNVTQTLRATRIHDHIGDFRIEVWPSS